MRDLSNGGYSKEVAERYEISRKLNNLLNGLLCGTASSLCEITSRTLNVPIECVTVFIDPLENPTRNCWSIHVDYNGEHYESTIRNMDYWDGDEG